MKVINYCNETNESISILISEKGINVWLDVFILGDEYTAEWNKYIFNLKSKEDLEIKKFQENIENFELASSLTINFFFYLKSVEMESEYTKNVKQGIIKEINKKLEP